MIYLDNAATSYPKPYTVEKAMRYAMAFAGGNHGRGSSKMAHAVMEIVYGCREKLGVLFHIRDPSRIVFTANATQALNTAMMGILRPGDTLLTSVLEHNSVLRPAEALKEKGVTVRYMPAEEDGSLSVRVLEEYLSPPPKLVVLTHASNVTGMINDIGAFGRMIRAAGSIFTVDAAQTAGCVPINVEDMQIDLLAFPGHKGLLGPTGTGGLYVRDGIAVSPLCYGGTGTASKSLVQPVEFPEHLESGTLNTVGIAGLSAGLSYILHRTVEDIAAHEQRLIGRLIENVSGTSELSLLGAPNGRCGTASFRLEHKEPVALSEALATRFDIATRAGWHCAPLAHRAMGTENTGAIRLSVGPFSTKADIDTASAALLLLLKD